MTASRPGSRRPILLPGVALVLAFVWSYSPDSTSAGLAQEREWSIEEPGGPTTLLEYTADDGTWISVDVSPDGQHLAFDLLGHVYEMPIAGGNARRLTDGRSWNLSPRYSPDGARIAFTSDRSGSFDVWIIERQSGRLANVSNSPDNVFRPSWSPDGRQVYAGTAPGLTAYGLGGGSTVLVENRSGVATVEPSGDGLYFEQGRPLYPFEFNPYAVVNSGARIERHDLRTGETDVRVERPGGAFNPALSRDGRMLAYLTRDIDDTVLIVKNLETRKERVILRGLDPDRQEGGGFAGPYANMAWHPDGQQIFVWFGGGIHAVDLQGGQPRRIPFRAPVRRELTETLRFPTDVPDGTFRTRAHRWASRTPAGVPA